jgi:Asp-tRNA(Asn)/Glu-tRNA(Gln) amidotransferase C subunit
VDEIIKLVEKLTKKDLANLKRWIQQNKQRRNPERPDEVQEWIDESSNNLASTINDASKDNNRIARKMGERMKNLMS